MFPNITYISLLFHFLSIIITSFPAQSQSQPVHDYSRCNDVDHSYNCGNISNIEYPFWGQNRPFYCGAGNPFYLNCHSNSITTILLSSQNFTVLDINAQDHTIKLKRTDLSQNFCSPQYNDTFLSPKIFQYLPSVHIIDIYYNCTYNVSQNLLNKSLCGSHNPSFSYSNVPYDENLDQKRCEKHIEVRVGEDNSEDLENDLDKGFEVEYSVNEGCLNCLGNEGYCSSDYLDKNVDLCYYDNCPDGSIDNNCSPLHNSMFSYLFIS
jgi:hypothetical protein